MDGPRRAERHDNATGPAHGAEIQKQFSWLTIFFGAPDKIAGAL
jgi:hypothetical protein